MNRWLALHYPALAAVCAAALWCYGHAKFPPDEKEFLGAAISIGSILTGFIATAKAILAALPSDSVMDRLRKSGYINDLVRYLSGALYGCLAFSVFSMMGFFFMEPDKHVLNGPYAGAWVALAVYALASFYRVSSLLMKIIQYQ